MMKTARIALCASLLAGTQMLMTPMASAQDATDLVAEYSTLVEKMSNIKLSTMQREVMLQRQQEQIASLEAQIAQVPETTAAVRDIAIQMANEIEKQIEKDIPFRPEERYARLGSLLDLINDEAARPVDMYRRAMNVLDIEANYGNSISAYTGDNPVNPGRRLAACRENLDSQTCNLSKDTREKLDAGANLDGKLADPADVSGEVKDGNYVHFGRMAFIYLDLDSREGYRWNQETKEWDAMASSDIINARRAVRIARGESAPGVVTAPIRVEAAQ